MLYHMFLSIGLGWVPSSANPPWARPQARHIFGVSALPITFLFNAVCLCPRCVLPWAPRRPANLLSNNFIKQHFQRIFKKYREMVVAVLLKLMKLLAPLVRSPSGQQSGVSRVQTPKAQWGVGVGHTVGSGAWQGRRGNHTV